MAGGTFAKPTEHRPKTAADQYTKYQCRHGLASFPAAVSWTTIFIFASFQTILQAIGSHKPERGYKAAEPQTTVMKEWGLLLKAVTLVAREFPCRDKLLVSLAAYPAPPSRPERLKSSIRLPGSRSAKIMTNWFGIKFLSIKGSGFVPGPAIRRRHKLRTTTSSTRPQMKTASGFEAARSEAPRTAMANRSRNCPTTHQTAALDKTVTHSGGREFAPRRRDRYGHRLR